MRLTDLPEDHVTLLLGAPRSGTTWLGKIIDSHPQVLYRHEPDSALRARELPMICPQDRFAAHRDMARAYLRALMNVTLLSTAASLPLFAKSYRLGVLGAARRKLVHVLHAMAGWRALRQRVRLMQVPDCIRASRAGDMHLVMKSIRSRGRAGLFARAMPQARIVFVLRDPFSHAAAMLRGSRHGHFSSRFSLAELLATPQAAKAGLTEDAYRQLSVVEKIAWNWTILNQKALDDLAGLERVKIVHYRDLCLTPIATAREVFDFLGLEWSQQTEAFIRASVEYEGKDPAWRLYRNARRSLNRWQSDLREEDRACIEAVVRTTSLWDLCAVPAET